MLRKYEYYMFLKYTRILKILRSKCNQYVICIDFKMIYIYIYISMRVIYDNMFIHS